MVKLYVGNLSYTTTEADLETLFAKAGQVALVKDRDTGNSKGFAFVAMSSQVEVRKAISMFNGFDLDDRELKVNPAKPRETRQSGFDRRRRF